MTGHPVELEALLQDLRRILTKYTMPKGMGFVPDRLDISVQRTNLEHYEVTYEETFSYLPPDVLSMGKTNALELIRAFGIPQESITDTKDGVSLTLKGGKGIILFPVIEMFLQNPSLMLELVSNCERLRQYIEVFSQIFDFHWTYDAQTAKKLDQYLAQVERIASENPEMEKELDAVISRLLTYRSSGEPKE